LSHESAHSQLEYVGQNQDAKSLDDLLKSIDSVSANDINAVGFYMCISAKYCGFFLRMRPFNEFWRFYLCFRKLISKSAAIKQIVFDSY